MKILDYYSYDVGISHSKYYIDIHNWTSQYDPPAHSTESINIYLSKIHHELKELWLLCLIFSQCKGNGFNSWHNSIIWLIGTKDMSSVHLFWIESVKNWQRYNQFVHGISHTYLLPSSARVLQLMKEANMNWDIEVPPSHSICHHMGRSYIQLKCLLKVNPIKFKWRKTDDFW